VRESERESWGGGSERHYNSGGGGSEIIFFGLNVPRHCPLGLLIRVRLEFRIISTFFNNFKVIGVGGAALERNLDRHLEGYITAKFQCYRWEGSCEACSATWNLGTNSAFALGPRKTTENPDRVGRSQDLSDAN
jgi:hypothetical protein